MKRWHTLFLFTILLFGAFTTSKAEQTKIKEISQPENRFNSKKFPLRNLTNDEGKQLLVEILDFDPSKKLVKLSPKNNGRIRWYALSTLGEKDRDFIVDWYTKRQIALNLLIEAETIDFNYQPYNTGNRLRGYSIRLRNYTPIELKNIELRYMIFKNEGKFTNNPNLSEKSSNIRRSKDGHAVIPSLPPRQTINIQSIPIELKHVRVDTIELDLNGVKTTHKGSKDNLKGLWCRIYYNGVLVKEWSTPQSVIQTNSWTHSMRK